VGIDGSDDSVVALRWAAWFASLMRHRLVVAHAWQYGRRLELSSPTPPEDVGELEADIVKTLWQLVVRELDDPAIVERCLALRGPIVPALESEAAESGAQLIVIGARGAGGALRTLLGSVSRELTRVPRHLVAVVPPDAPVVAPDHRRIVVGVDGSDPAARALRWAAYAAARADSEVVAVHAFTPPVLDPTQAEETSLLRERRDRFEQEWCAPLRAAGVAHRCVLEVGDPREVLRRVADEYRPICGVVGSRGLGALSARLLGSVTHHVVRELAWPVVVVPSPRDATIWPPPGLDPLRATEPSEPSAPSVDAGERPS